MFNMEKRYRNKIIIVIIIIIIIILMRFLFEMYFFCQFSSSAAERSLK